MVDIQYYHRPIITPDSSKPLVGCVVTITTYGNFERSFLKGLITRLGGYEQENFCRVDNKARDLKGSTHLISPEPTGKKYEGAIRWKLPVLTKDWLLECAKTGTRAPEHPFLVGDAQGKSLYLFLMVCFEFTNPSSL